MQLLLKTCVALTLSLCVTQSGFAQTKPKPNTLTNSRVNLGQEISLRLNSGSGEQSKALRLSLKHPKNVTPEVFHLVNPERLVIDLPGITIKRNQRVALPEHSAIVEIRAGVHPDRLRLVLDFAEDAANSTSTFSKEVEEAELRVTFPEAASVASEPLSFSVNYKIRNVALKSERKGLLAQHSAPNQQTPSDSTPNTDEIVSEIPTNEESVAQTLGLKPVLLSATKVEQLSDIRASQHTPEAEANLAPKEVVAITSNMLSGIKFEPASHSVRFELQHPTPYTLTKKDAQTYLLRLEDISPIHTGLTLPFFPPGDMVGLESVLAKAVDRNLEIELHIDDGAVVTAFLNEINGVSALTVRVSTR